VGRLMMSFDEQIGIIPNLNNLNLKRGKGKKKKKIASREIYQISIVAPQI
jgi:hypothetical protein